MPEMSEKDSLNTFKNELIALLDKSQSSFEKQLSYISSGTIGFSMFMIEKMFKDLGIVHFKYLMTLGWIVLAITLLINLCSHLFAFHFHYQTIREINNGEYQYERASKRNKKISCINWLSAFLLFIGIVLLIIFISLNL